MNKDIKNWWNEYADYYQRNSKILTETAHYGPFSPDEKELNLLGNVKGKKILELGCGGGQCSIAFARQGAFCTGIDFSEKQLALANELTRKAKVGVNFIKGDIQDFKLKDGEKFDIVFSSFALQFVPNLDKCFENVNKYLKKGGVFVFSLDHPFYAILSSDGRLESSYYKTGKYTEVTTAEVFGGKRKSDNKYKFTFYKRKVSDIFSSLINTGFDVERIIEPNNFSKKDPWAKMYSLDVISLIGPTIIFSAKKVK
ncbi:MAG: class I SAM-dependent methyltransferase [Candidatus Moranbacteria bacterium]|nr:class I SAM-dependent methyltransferase [Candidatus Moranbacteria bacterium]